MTRLERQVPVRSGWRWRRRVLVAWLAFLLWSLWLTTFALSMTACGRGGAPAPCTPRVPAIGTGDRGGASSPRCEVRP